MPIFLDCLIKLTDDPKTQLEALELNEKNFEKDWQGQLIAPELNPGDIVLFNGLTVIDRNRASILETSSFDLRFVSSRNVPTKYHGHTAIDINKQKWLSYHLKSHCLAAFQVCLANTVELKTLNHFCLIHIERAFVFNFRWGKF